MTEGKKIPVFKILRYVRDAGSTKNAQRELLYALVMRCNPEDGFKTFPSYRLLAQDTLLDEATLKRAAKKLEDAKLIRRRVRANRSNYFYINVGLLQQQAEARLKALEKAAEEEESPFAAPVIDSNDEEESNGTPSWMVSGGAR